MLGHYIWGSFVMGFEKAITCIAIPHSNSSALIPVMEIIDDDGNKLKKKDIKKTQHDIKSSPKAPVRRTSSAPAQRQHSSEQPVRTAPVRRVNREQVNDGIEEVEI